jgi:hypothetical protein
LTGCGCLILVGILIGGIVFMIFGSTDPGEPIEQFAVFSAGLLLLRVAAVPFGRALVRLRSA